MTRFVRAVSGVLFTMELYVCGLMSCFSHQAFGKMWWMSMALSK